MLKNYFTIALRFMVRQKGFSFINISGLTLGIASSLLILLYINDELSFDKFHRDASRIYRVTSEGKMQGKRIHSALTGYPLAPSLISESELVQSAVRMANWPTFPMRYEDRAFTEPNLLLADSNFFSFFDFPLIEGTADDVLLGEGKIVITESAAKRYFNYEGPGDRSPLGKKMVLAQGYVAQVSGIAADPPRQSHFHFTFVLSLDSWTEIKSEGWTSGRVITYVKVKPETEINELLGQLKTFTTKYVAPELKAIRNMDINQYRVQGNDITYDIQPLLSIHLHSDLSDEIEANGNAMYIYMFIAIAVFITLLACINFMNLSTARSASRAREIGVRKAIGAPNTRLILQFLFESYFYIVVAVVLALFIIMVMLGPFNYLTEKSLDSRAFFSPLFLSGIVVFIVTVGLLAGSYPAFYLTSFSPIEVLKGRVRTKLRSYGIRNVLVVFQFFISSSLIIATLTLYLQLRYVQNAELGFDKNNVINLIHTANLKANGELFKKELLDNDAIIAASYSNRLPPNIYREYVFRPVNTEKDFLLNVYEVDHDHLKTMRYAMTKGRYFSRDYPGDSLALILNETAAQRMGASNLLQQIYTDYGGPQGSTREVIGIVHDFNFQSLKDSIQPVAIVLGPEPNWEMAVRIKPEQEREAISHIQMLWKKYAPDAPFEYTFLTRNFEEKLKTEKKIGILFLLFTILAVFIASLGLFGLAAFSAEQRTKEIGIRKVLGASVENIVIMLNMDFLKLVLIANILALPVAAWLMSALLRHFAYHISTPWWIFVVAAATTALIAFLSVSTRAINAAKGDPVNSLRDE
jgi:putative ABC transport system permease protein